jgi:hypothetical protein
VGYAAAVRVRPPLSILVLFVVAWLAPAAQSAPVGSTRVQVDETCSYRLLSGNAVAFTTSYTLSSARGGRSSSVRVIAGWNIERLYPKAKTAWFVRLGAGQTLRRVVTHRIPSVPRLWAKLRATGRLNCASSYTYTIP